MNMRDFIKKTNLAYSLKHQNSWTENYFLFFRNSQTTDRQTDRQTDKQIYRQIACKKTFCK